MDLSDEATAVLSKLSVMNSHRQMIRKLQQKYAMQWQRTAARALFACLLIGLLATTAAALLQQHLHVTTPSATLLLPALRELIAPEPIERLIFIGGLITGPLVILVISINTRCKTDCIWGSDRLDLLLSLLSLALLLGPLALSLAMRVIIGPSGLTQQATLIHTVSSLAVATSAILIIQRKQIRRSSTSISRSNQLKTSCFILCLLITLASLVNFRLFGFERLSGSAVWSDHLDAVISAIAQVRAGNTLLVDAPSQYGLFPELLAPVLWVLPTGLMGISVAFAILQVVGLSTLLLWLKARLCSPLVFLTAALALLATTFGTHSLYGFRLSEPDPYFQYWPVRFIGPALSIPLTIWFIKKLCWPRVIVVSAWTSLCLFWNLDSGASVFYANTMLLCLLSGVSLINKKRVANRPAGWLIKATLITPILSICLLAIALMLLSVRAGESLNPQSLITYQNTFYGLGFMMMPLPAWPDGWHTIIAGYIICLTIGLIRLNEGKSLQNNTALLYIPLLGLGLFIYYQGRSHFFNLVSVSWPLIIATALLIDRHIRALRYGLLSPLTAGLPTAGLTALLMPALALLGCTPSLVVQTLGTPFNKPHPNQAPAPYLNTERQLIKDHCKSPDVRCLLLLKRQGIYALESGIASAWKGASPAELLLQNDRNQLIQALQQGLPQRIILGVGRHSRLHQLNDSGIDWEKHYRLIGTNKEATAIVLDRKRDAQRSTAKIIN